MKYQILDQRSIVKISGVDRENFLQSLTTNDVINNEFSFNLMLNPQGRYLFDFFVYNNKDEDYFLIDISNKNISNFLNKINLYKLRSKVNIEDVSSSYKVIYCDEKQDTINIKYFKDPRYQDLSYRLYIDINTQNFDKLFNKSAFINDENLYFNDKYSHSIIDGDFDMEYEKSLPPEFGIEYLNGISYIKGCYVGQEVVSRAKYLGTVRKKIFNITSDNLNLQPMTDIISQGKKIGKILSRYKNNYLALLRIEDSEIKNFNIEIEGHIVKAYLAKWYG